MFYTVYRKRSIRDNLELEIPVPTLSDLTAFSGAPLFRPCMILSLLWFLII